MARYVSENYTRSNTLSENQVKAAVMSQNPMDAMSLEDEYGDKRNFYTISWLAQAEHVNPMLPCLTQPRWNQFSGTAREVYATIQWVKAQMERGVVLDVKIERLIRDRTVAVENGYHWHTINGVPEFHSWDDCPENLEDWLDYKDEE